MSPATSSAPGARILIVEDEVVVAIDVEMQLTAFGYQVTAIASTVDEALRSIRTNPPDLVLLDMQLHGRLDGVTAASKIREMCDLPIVFVTAFSMEEARQRAQAITRHALLSKPYLPQDLYRVISDAIDGYGATSLPPKS